jgi:hypothetical protein
MRLFLAIVLVAVTTAGHAQSNSAAAAKNLDSKGARAYVTDRLQEFCERANPHLNWIKVSVRGNGLFCVHDLFGRYTLSAGSFGPAMGSWVSQHEEALKKAKISRVGVWGTGSYATGAYFDVK